MLIMTTAYNIFNTLDEMLTIIFLIIHKPANRINFNHSIFLLLNSYIYLAVNYNKKLKIIINSNE